MDSKVRRMQRKGRFQVKTVSHRNNKELRKQVLQSMSKRQKRAWKKMTPQEREKLLQSVEKKVSAKLDRQYKGTSGNSAKKVPKSSTQKQNYLKTNPKQGNLRVYKCPDQSSAKTVRLDAEAMVGRKRVIRKTLKKLERNEKLSPDQKILRVNSVKRPPAIKGISQNDQKKLKVSLALEQLHKNKGIPDKKSRVVPVRGEKNQLQITVDALHSRQNQTEKEYNRQFGKEIKKISRKQTKLYSREFTFQLNREIQKIRGKEEAQKDIQREKTYEELSTKGFAGSVRAASLPLSLPLKIKTEKLMMQIAAAIGGVIASVVSAVLPIIAVIAVIVSVFSFIAGFFGVLAGSWDPASAGLPDAAYVTNTAVQWAEYIAENDDHGYNDGYFSRWGPTDYSNITFVVTAFDRTGLQLKKDGAKEAEDLYDACLLNGFLDVKDEVSSYRDLKTGDILVKLGREPRVEIYCGNKKMVGAICDERGKQKHGESGDQTGKEICIETYSNQSWDYVLRYYGDMTLYGGIGSELVEFALSFVGKLPYVWGGSSLVTGADCSGFVQAVYAHFGYSIPRTAGAQYASGRKVGRNINDWQPGDIIYYSQTGSVQNGGTGEHIVIYCGNGKVVGESSTTTGCVVYNWDYRSDYLGTARYLPDFDSSAVLIGNDNSTKIWNYLRRTLGCSRAAAAGVMGSIYAESGFDPTAVQPNGVGHGICQWSWSRWYGSDGLQNFANKHHKNWTDLALQLAFFKHEAVENNSLAAYYPGGWQKYKALINVEGDGGTAHVFFYSFEYGAYVSYSTFTSSEFETNFACTSKRLAIARSCYNNPGTYP